MADTTALFVAREADVDAIRTNYKAVAAGATRIMRLQAPFGGGRRAAAGEFLRDVSAGDDPPIIWRVVCLEQENGLQWLVRMYGSLMAALSGDVLLRGKVEMILNSQLPSQPQRVQGWYQEFVGALKDAKPDADKGSISLRLPRDNPLLGLVEIVCGISRRHPIVLDLQNAGVVYSLALAQFLQAVSAEGNEHGSRLLVIAHDEPEGEVKQSLYPMPLLDFYERGGDAVVSHVIEPWGEAEVSKFLDSKGVKGNAARVAEISSGKPGFVAELVDILGDAGTLDTDLEGVSFASLTPVNVDESALTAAAADKDSDASAEGGENKREAAKADDAKRIAYLGALLGQAFPSGLVADMGGFTRDSVDDLIDACGDLFEEVQFANDLGTWIYKFKRGSWREGILEMHDDDDGRALAQRVGVFMERFLVPRGYGFIVKTARIYAENGAPNRAAVMRSVALSNDSSDVWGLAYDLCNYFDEVTWPDALRRTVFMNLLDRMIGGGNVEAAERVYTEATAWAQGKEDREMTAWLLFAGSRLDNRRQDYYRARDRAQDALKLYTAMENKVRAAEIQNHIAGIEVQDGNPNAALEAVDKALQLAMTDGENGEKVVPPNVFANAEQIRGLVARRAGDFEKAIESFRRANEAAGTTGLAQLALDSGLSFGEALLASGKVEEGRQALGRVIEIATQLQNPVRERNARELMAQAEGNLRNFDEAVKHAARVLELTQSLKFERALPVDLYNLGFFHYASGKPSEALTFFRQAEQGVSVLGEHPVVKELYYWQGLAYLKTNQPAEGRTSLRKALRPLQQAKDTGKMVSAMDHLAAIEAQSGNTQVAQKLLVDAVKFALKANMKKEAKELKKRLRALTN
ncbi:MAG: tetratricopeptide repeat protein [Myxococcota bacterium]